MPRESPWVPALTPLPCGHFPPQALSEKASTQLSGEPLTSSISNFYMTDVISRHSPVMAHCVKARKEMYTGGK